MADKPDRRTAWAAKDRAAKKARGLVRRDVWCYPDDWPEIQATAERLTTLRESWANLETSIEADDLSLKRPGAISRCRPMKKPARDR